MTWTISGKKILVFENDRVLLKALMAPFVDAGCEVLRAVEVSDVASMLAGTKFDAIILAFSSGADSVLHLATSCRAKGPNRSSEIVVLVSPRESVAAQKVGDLGFVDLVRKPYYPHEVFLLVKKRLHAQGLKRNYDVRIINCFLKPTQEIMGFYSGGVSKVETPKIKTTNIATGYASGLIGLTGPNMAGSVSVTCQRGFLELFAANALGLAPHEVTDDLFGDLTGELCNQISGKAQHGLAQIGIDLSIGLPEIVIGVGHTIAHKTDNPVIMIPVTLGHHRGVLEFSIAEKGSKEGESGPAAVNVFVEE